MHLIDVDGPSDCFSRRAHALLSRFLEHPSVSASRNSDCYSGGVVAAWHTKGGVGAVGTAPCFSHWASARLFIFLKISRSRKFPSFDTNTKKISTCHREASF